MGRLQSQYLGQWAKDRPNLFMFQDSSSLNFMTTQSITLGASEKQTDRQTHTQTHRQTEREIQTSCSRVIYKWRGFQLRQVIHVLSLWTPGRLWPNVRPICSPEKGSHTHIYATQAHFYGAYLHCLSLQCFLILSNFTPSWYHTFKKSLQCLVNCGKKASQNIQLSYQRSLLIFNSQNYYH